MEIQFKYAAIRTDQFASFDCPSDFSLQDCSLNGEVQTANNYDARSIMIKVVANIKCGDNLVLTLGVSSFFEIEESSWRSMIKDGFVIVPKDFLWHIGGLAVSTTRGILFAKTENGASISGRIFTIVQTAKANALVVDKYLEYALENINKVPIEDLLPWSEKLPKELSIKQYIK